MHDCDEHCVSQIRLAERLFDALLADRQPRRSRSTKSPYLLSDPHRLVAEALANCNEIRYPMLMIPRRGSNSPATARRGVVSRLLDTAQGSGIRLVALDELARDAGLTPLAVRRQLARLGARTVRAPGRPAAALIVTPEDAANGAPPPAAWLDAYFRLRNEPYYVGLLSAAAFHGSSSQAVQSTQVLVTRPTRALVLGRVSLRFFVKKDAVATPRIELPGLLAPLAVSTPEATALDLIAFQSRLGGIERVTEVIAGLLPRMTAAGLKSALQAEPAVAVRQRLGYVLEVLGRHRLAAAVRASLPGRLTPVRLKPEGRSGAPSRSPEVKEPWAVYDNVALSKDRS